MEEEQTLLNELRKIELRKKEREKKTQDLQKLITAADSSQSETKRLEKKGPKKKVIQQKNIKTDSTVSTFLNLNSMIILFKIIFSFMVWICFRFCN